MRLKSVIKYNIYDIKYGVLIYYAVIAAIMGLLVFTQQSRIVNINSDEIGFVSGAEASVIFLFVCGLNSFKQNYLYLSTNGITRKAQFYGFLSSSAIVAAAMAFIDTASTNIINVFINYHPMFYQIFKGFTAESSQLLITLMNFLWSTAVYLLAFVIGYFLTALYYRMSKILKIIVSIGVAALLVIVFPILSVNIYNSSYAEEFSAVVKFLMFGNGAPSVSVVISVLETLVIAGLSYLLVRRAPVKE